MVRHVTDEVGRGATRRWCRIDLGRAAETRIDAQRDDVV